MLSTLNLISQSKIVNEKSEKSAEPVDETSWHLGLLTSDISSFPKGPGPYKILGLDPSDQLISCLQVEAD